MLTKKKKKKMERVTFYFRISLVYMHKENAAVVTTCLRIQHVPSNLRNYASYSKLHDGCVSLCTEYIRNTKSALHSAMHVPLQSRDIIIRLLVTSPFKTVHSQIFAKIIMTKFMDEKPNRK